MKAAIQVAVLACMSAGARSLDAQRIDTTAVIGAIEREMRATRSPGAAIAIVVGDRVVFERGFGVANIEREERVTSETLFRIGSVTKMFTGLTALSLVRDGLVDLRQPVTRYAPDLDSAFQSVTLRDLLSHMGGITNEAANTGPHDDRALGDRVRGWKSEHVFAESGDVYSYTGPGYWLAGYVLEQAGKQWYADLVTRRVLEPLGMTRSTFRPTMAMTWPVALDHRVAQDRATVLRPSPDDASTWPSGSLYSSASELARLAIAFMNGGRIDGAQVLPADAVSAMSTRQGGLPGDLCGYSYGLSVCTRGSARVLSHYGFRVGSGAVFTMLPEERVAVIVLSNRNGGIFGATERAVLAQLPPSTTVASPESAARPSAPRASFAGTYVSGSDTLRLIQRNDSLFYRYATNEMRTRAEGDSAILILDPSGQPVQQFRLVRGVRSGRVFLHDGLNAFRLESR